MKSIVKKSYLLLLSLLWWFLVVWFVSVTMWITVINTHSDDSEHRVMLHSLYLDGNVTGDVLMWVNENEEALNVRNWLIVGSGIIQWDGDFCSVGWWLENKIEASANGWSIWWWGNNNIHWWENSVIGGGHKNMTRGDNSVVVWWYNNSWFNGWVVLWWSGWGASVGGVALWGKANKAMSNSLVLWKNAQWNMNSFTWNSVAQSNEARINADSWVLIWTYTPIDSVSLVVSWSIKLNNGNDNIWAIRYNNWCLTMYDGHTHILGRSSKSVCGVASWCQFGSILLQDWDVVTGYSVSYSTNCNTVVVTGVTCVAWNLSAQVYPYCYNIDSNPVGN